ncbi:hypothetical protein C0J52_26232 [Blattella germanica]|nr:hypothetical protein C0J52_26232 [Blattella germanica]
MGPAPDEETLLVMWIVTCARKGFPKRKLDIHLSVKCPSGLYKEWTIHLCLKVSVIFCIYQIIL